VATYCKDFALDSKTTSIKFTGLLTLHKEK